MGVTVAILKSGSVFHGFWCGRLAASAAGRRARTALEGLQGKASSGPRVQAGRSAARIENVSGSQPR
jgi:hypothetical protein